MWRKIISLLSVLIIITSLTSFVYADNGNSSRYQVLLPEEAVSTHRNKAILISGKAPIDTSITIELYGVVDLTGNKYSLVNLPNDEDYTLISVVNTKSGPLGFAEEIELMNGINKIIIKFNVEGVAPVEKIVYYYEAQQLFDNIRNIFLISTAN
ncbi:MAG: crossover junction endodeoxyribonuclease RuvC [Tissierellia bacterium]|nr:crossover junction endodeoxyribonuclease RuvC [Tissierellia bacterium]